MNISLIVTNTSIASNQKIMNDSRDLGHKCVQILASELKKDIKFDLLINRVSGITYDDSDLSVLSQMKYVRKIVNLPERSAIYRDKFIQSKEHLNHSVETYLITEDIPISKSSQWVLKPVRSNGGRGVVFLSAKDLEDKRRKIIESDDQRYVVQPFINYKDEYRFLFAGEKLIAQITKKRNKDNKHNYGDSNFSISKIPEKLTNLARSIYKESHLELAAIDLFMFEDKYYLLEINSVPGLENIQACFPDRNIIKEILLELTKDL